ncbi:MAG: NAD(P)/FAD-dependent oxidoreductase [Ruminococcaceae bacterium]|nr:NAD(P)/FAD-dependent oxidoreductase [Oscillospiraceae bacterium]
MKCDVLVIGACTAGVYFAKRMAEQGYRVMVADKCGKEELGKRLSIFHMDAAELKRYGAPVPEQGKDFVHSFKFSASRSALGRWEKYHEHTVYVMNLPAYIQRLVRWAREYGASFAYKTEFRDLIIEEGRVVGAKLFHGGKELTVEAGVVVDCTGIAAAARTKLPAGCVCENFALEQSDKFYVTVNYISFLKPEKVHIRHTISWPYYKVWIAPREKEQGAILGVGANMSYAYGERCLQKFLENISIPEFKVDKVERGAVPYHRPPYSFVADGFFALGDSACLTKPNNGEGITAAWFLADIAAEEIGEALRNALVPTAEDMWGVNVRYQRSQGAQFAELLATMTGAVDCSPEENNYEFRHNLIFKSNLRNQQVDKEQEKKDLIKGLLKGVLQGKMRLVTIKKLLHYSTIASKIKHHYLDFPVDIHDYPAWKETADALWATAGSMADVVYDEKYYLNDCNK